MVIENAYALEEIKLGRRGENQARKVVFDVLGKWREGYGDGVASLIVQRNGDAQPYPVTVTEDDGALVWMVSSVDTAVAGEGAAELRYTVGDTIVKSQIYKTRVRETLEDSGETPPPAFQSWVDEVLQAAADAETAVSKMPYVDETTGNWFKWDAAAGAFADTGVAATGPQGEVGPQGPTGPAGADGAKGADGAAGKDGVTYTPSVSDAGVISWTNDGGKTNPKSVSIKGPKGDTGATGADGAAGPQGPKGDPGETGPQGPAGPANVLTIGSVTSGKVASATITGEAPNQVLNLVLEKGDKGETGEKGATGDTGPQGEQGIQGPQGSPGTDAPTITGITIRQSDYHLIVTLSNGTSYDAGYCRGASGAGTGDMLASVYDPQNKHQDIFSYIDNAIKDVKVTTDATPTQGSANPVQSGGVYSALVNKLDKTGDGSNVTAAFTAARTRANIATGEKLSVLFGKIAKWFADLGTLAFKSTVAKSDLASDVQASLGKADSALQSAPVTSVNGATGEVKGTFYVTVTQGDNYNITADKTAMEVYKAYAAGYAVYAITKFPETDVPFVLPLVSAVNMRDMILLGFAALGSLSPEAAPNYPVVAYNGANKKWTTWFGTLATPGDIPSELKNPYSLNIKIGDTTTSYDGSATKTVKIPEGWPTMRKVTLPVTGWNSSTKQQSVTVTGVLADGTKQRVSCSPVDESYDSAWNSCYVQCVGHGADSLAFQCDEIPTAAIEVYVSIQPVRFAS